MGKISLNGELVPEDEAKVSVFDRGFLYGDGVFETLRVREGQPRLLFQHLGRLQHGLDTLRVKPDLELDEFSTRVEKLIAANEVKNGVLRIQVTRGTGERGFAPIGEGKATVMLSTHPLPEPSPNKDGLRLMTSTQVVRAHDPLSTIKSCNKLPYILAAREAVRYQMDDALLMNREGEVTETTDSNIFWVDEGIICTPPISVSCLRVRAMACTGDSARRISSVAAGMSDGSAARRASSSGCWPRCQRPARMVPAVVSRPATKRR